MENFKNEILAANNEKIGDVRKRFMVKLWFTLTERKNGNLTSYLHWKFERCNYLELVNLLITHVKSMAEHSLMASWNYWQYKQAKRNIIPGDIIMVHDFAQNYLCKHQNECQGLHWHHKQVTVMPTVVHYICSTCKGMVTHEMVHISEDLKHDAHLVKKFTERSEHVLQNNGLEIHKIIEFTDQAPSQYKNKTAFNYLTQRKVPVLKNYFGVHHGKSSCDACTGKVKQGVTRLVKSGTEVVNSTRSFYECCVKHLQKPLLKACQHYILTFEFHNKLSSRPDTKKWPGIPEMRKFHSICNTENNYLYFHTFLCCCNGCLHGTENCSNTVCPEEWNGYNLPGKKNCQPDRLWWCRIANEQIRKISKNIDFQHQVDWVARIATMSATTTFDELVAYVHNNPLPPFTDQLNDIITQEELHNLDMVALHHIPDDAPQRVAPISIEGDGNCFPRTISYILYKSETKYSEKRARIVYEAVINMNSYLDNIYVSIGARNFYDRGTLPEQ